MWIYYPFRILSAHCAVYENACPIMVVIDWGGPTAIIETQHKSHNTINCAIMLCNSNGALMMLISGNAPHTIWLWLYNICIYVSRKHRKKKPRIVHFSWMRWQIGDSWWWWSSSLPVPVHQSETIAFFYAAFIARTIPFQTHERTHRTHRFGAIVVFVCARAIRRTISTCTAISFTCAFYASCVVCVERKCLCLMLNNGAICIVSEWAFFFISTHNCVYCLCCCCSASSSVLFYWYCSV